MNIMAWTVYKINPEKRNSLKEFLKLVKDRIQCLQHDMHV